MRCLCEEEKEESSCVSILVTFDPGSQTGWAVFLRGKLRACGYCSKKKLWEEKVWKAVRTGSLVVVEIPILYHTHKERNPQAVLTNGILGGEIKGFALARGALVEEVSPARKWKGTIPKVKAGEKYLIEERVLLALSSKECQLIKKSKSARARGLNHNLIDAVGIGLWRLRK